MRCVEDEEDHDLPNSTAHVINTSREIRFSWFALAGWGVLCRGDVKRSIVFDVVGYDTAVARGDLLFFLFCFFLFFFLPVFSGLDDRKRLQQEDCATMGTGTSVVVVVVIGS